MSTPTDRLHDPNSTSFDEPTRARNVRRGHVSEAATALAPEQLHGAAEPFEEPAIQRPRRSLDPEFPPEPPRISSARLNSSLNYVLPTTRSRIGGRSTWNGCRRPRPRSTNSIGKRSRFFSSAGKISLPLAILPQHALCSNELPTQTTSRQRLRWLRPMTLTCCESSRSIVLRQIPGWRALGTKKLSSLVRR